jgi:hypothetical protein
MNNIKMQLTEFCQKCKNVQNIKGNTVNREEKTSDGETKSIVTVSYHCEACHTFIRSEELKQKK